MAVKYSKYFQDRLKQETVCHSRAALVNTYSTKKGSNKDREREAEMNGKHLAYNQCIEVIYILETTFLLNNYNCQAAVQSFLSSQVCEKDKERFQSGKRKQEVHAEFTLAVVNAKKKSPNLHVCHLNRKACHDMQGS